jgi:hypothetical protein
MPIQKVSNLSRPEAPRNDQIREVIPKKSKIGLIILILIAVLATAGFGLMLKKYIETKKQLAIITSVEGQKEIAKKEVSALLEKVGKLIVLPLGEEPTVATITDAEALKKEQSFYSDARNGNRVIIYMQAKKAIIYDEEKNILINVGPIFLNEETESPPVGYEGDVN